MRDDQRRLESSSTVESTVLGTTASKATDSLVELDPLVGGLSFHDVSAMCRNPLVHGLPRGVQAQSV